MKKDPTGPIDKRMLKIAQKLKKLRKEAGFKNYEAFAWEHELNRSQYWRIEKGANITLASLFEILDIHNLTLKEFFEDID